MPAQKEIKLQKESIWSKCKWFIIKEWSDLKCYTSIKNKSMSEILQKVRTDIIMKLALFIAYYGPKSVKYTVVFECAQMW